MQVGIAAQMAKSDGPIIHMAEGIPHYRMA